MEEREEMSKREKRFRRERKGVCARVRMTRRRKYTRRQRGMGGRDRLPSFRKRASDQGACVARVCVRVVGVSDRWQEGAGEKCVCVCV